MELNSWIGRQQGEEMSEKDLIVYYIEINKITLI
jgi:hypothetical protein